MPSDTEAVSVTQATYERYCAVLEVEFAQLPDAAKAHFLAWKRPIEMCGRHGPDGSAVKQLILYARSLGDLCRLLVTPAVPPPNEVPPVAGEAAPEKLAGPPVGLRDGP